MTQDAHKTEYRRAGEAIRARRTELGWSLQKLADLVGCAKGYLSEVETGRRGPPGEEFLARVEAFMMMPGGRLVELARWERSLEAGGPTVERELGRLRQRDEIAQRLAGLLRAGGAGKSVDPAFRSGELRRLIAEYDAQAGQANIAPLPGARAQVPLINKVAAGYPREFTDLAYPARVADEYVSCPDVDDPDAFAARVVGDSMSPDYREGDIIIFSPARTPRNGNDCFVRLERDHETTFKRVYFEAGENGAELIRLQPINNTYPPRVVDREEVAGLYAAVKAIREVG